MIELIKRDRETIDQNSKFENLPLGKYSKNDWRNFKPRLPIFLIMLIQNGSFFGSVLFISESRSKLSYRTLSPKTNDSYFYFL